MFGDATLTWLRHVCAIGATAELAAINPRQPLLTGTPEPPRPLAGDEHIGRIASRFLSSRNRAQALEAAREAITFMTTNSNSINNALKAGDASADVRAFHDAVTYALQNSPDYGEVHNVVRLKDYSAEELEVCLRGEDFLELGFSSASPGEVDTEVQRPFRNTVMHIEARWGANVTHLSPNPSLAEYLLEAGSRFQVLRGELRRREDPEGCSQPVKAELWLRQCEPPASSRIIDPWKVRRRNPA